MAKQNKGLGRGLNSLLGGSAEEAAPMEQQRSEEKPRFMVDASEELAEAAGAEKAILPNNKEDKLGKSVKEEQAIAETAVAETAAKEKASEASSFEKAKTRGASASEVSEVEVGARVNAEVETRMKASDEEIQEKTAKKASRPPVKATPQRATSSISNKVAAQEAKTKSEIDKIPVQTDDNVVIKEVVERVPNEVPLLSVKPNPDQPRTNFKSEDLEELASSIEKDGLLQPILVRQLGDDYQIIAGERRWQACRSLGLSSIPVRIKDANDDKALELALIENIQRSDLNPIEEAYGYRRLMDRQGLTQSEVAQAVSKGRSTVANALRLLELPEAAQQMLFEDKISAGHARAILSIPSKEGKEKLTNRLLEEKLSVRESEAYARLFSASAKDKESGSTRVPTPLSFKKIARALRDSLETNVRVKTVKGKNKIEIEFSDEDDLEQLFEKLTAFQEG